MIPVEIASHLQEVPEALIKQASESTGGENNFHKLLKAAEVFRFAQTTPIFLSNQDFSAFCVSSKETFNAKKLH
jgi:hypothetical protein